MNLIIKELGRLEYDEAQVVQKSFHQQVVNNQNNGILLILELQPVFTIGRFGNEKNILIQTGIPVRRVERGGDVTYHGPGQLVAYPLVSLYKTKIGVRNFIDKLQNVIIRTVRTFGVDCNTKEKCIGVFTGQSKIASIGLAVSKRVTFHGIALNVNNDLTPFTFINPCGFKGLPATSIKDQLKKDVQLEDVIPVFKKEFLNEFRLQSVKSSWS